MSLWWALAIFFAPTISCSSYIIYPIMTCWPWWYEPTLLQAIEEIVYEKAQDVAGDLEIWESEHAMMVYKQICSTLIARLPSVRRLCSARPSLLVEKLLKVSKVPLINCVPQSYQVHQGVTKGGWKQLFPHSYALTSDTCWRGYGGKADFQA